MFFKNSQIRLLPIFILLLSAGLSCTSVVPHSGCYVADSALRGTYSGECQGGKAHGQGIARGEDIYQGQFAQGWPHGEGTYIWSDGDRYIGQFKNGQAHGRGVMRFEEGGEIQ
ncbi:MAG: hypothetical protein SVR94_03805, partial [Pseudomonadota bacterium]|nr:hypothetical protein [Pseudomonadota bacterium]